jgi:uncharacterized small protein (DUF1192 family)
MLRHKTVLKSTYFNAGIGGFMFLEDLVRRLIAVENKLTVLTGELFDSEEILTLDHLDERLSIVELEIDSLVAEKAKSCIDEIVLAPANEVKVTVDQVVALSPSSYIPEAAAIVASVVQDQIESPAVAPEVAEVVSVAISTIVSSSPEVLTDSVAITAAITDAIAQAPVPPSELVDTAAVAVANIISTVTGEEVTLETHTGILEAVVEISSCILEEFEERIAYIEAKIENLFN